MLPSLSSLPRLALEDRTNISYTKPFLSTQLSTPPADRKVKQHPAILHGGSRKRPRIELEEKGSADLYESDDNDVDMEDVATVRARLQKSTPFQRNIASAMRRPGNFRQLGSTYFQLQIFLLAAHFILVSADSSNTTVVRLVE